MPEVRMVVLAGDAQVPDLTTVSNGGNISSEPTLRAEEARDVTDARIAVMGECRVCGLVARESFPDVGIAHLGCVTAVFELVDEGWTFEDAEVAVRRWVRGEE